MESTKAIDLCLDGKSRGVQLDKGDSFDVEAPSLRILEPLAEVIGREGSAHWLFCTYCERFFQAQHLRIDYLGNRQGCAFCDSAGFGVAIFSWDTWRNPNEPWPASIAELHFGKQLAVWRPVMNLELQDDGVECSLCTSPEGELHFAFAFEDKERHERDASGTLWGTWENPILVPLGYAERRAARRARWRRLSRKARLIAKDPKRFRQRWRCADT
jgi:hypothetical protein